MSFNQDVKNRVISAAEQVYWAYLALEVANNEGKDSIASQINKAIQAGDFNPTLLLNNQQVVCQITDFDGEYDIKFGEANGLPGIVPLKKYTDADKQKVLASQAFTARMNPKTGKLALGVVFDEAHGGHEIGGPNKIELFKMHIANLGIMINELKTNKNPKTMLAALATGSGKTFTQGLWMFVLQMANVSGVFTTPAKLVHQLHGDLKRLLPDTVMRNIFEVNSIIDEDNADNEQITVDAVKEKLQTATKPIVVMPYEELLDQHWDLVSSHLDPESSFISFDEQHLVGRREDRALKLGEISKKFSSMFLTATPSEKSYELCGKKALLTLSKRQKVEQGYAVATENIHVKSKKVSENINEAKPYLETKKAWVKERLLSGMLNFMLGSERTPVAEFMSQTRFTAVIKKPDFQGNIYNPQLDGNSQPAQKVRNLLRWNTTIPAADKMLIIASDHDTLINVDKALVRSDYSGKFSNGMDEVYRKGNQMPRAVLKEDELLNKFRQTKLKEKLENYISTQLGGKSVDNSIYEAVERMSKERSMKEFANMVGFTGVMNNALRVITGFDFITLDKMRFNDLAGLVKLVMDNLKSMRNLRAHELKAQFIDQEGLSDDIASNLARDVLDIIDVLNQDWVSTENKIRLIDNWVFDAEENKDEVWGLRGDPATLSNVSKLYNCENIENNDAKIENYVPFSGFKSRKIPLYLADGRPNPEARNHKMRGFAALEQNGSVDGYATSPSNMTHQQMEKAFKLGLCPYLIGNTKAEGFNDENLQVTVHLVADEHDGCNLPAKKVQASGRPRGLNPTKLPIYMQIDNVGIKNVFSLKSLEKQDYIPDFLKGTKLFHETIFAKHGKLVAQELNDWIFTNTNAKGEVDGNELRKHVFKQVINVIQETNCNNDHNIKQSRKQLVKVLKSLSKELESESYQLKHTYQIPLFVKALVTLVNLVCRLFSYARFRSAKNKLIKACNEIKSSKLCSDDKKARAALYKKIVSSDFNKAIKTKHLMMNIAKLLQPEVSKLCSQAESLAVNDIRQCDNFYLMNDYLRSPIFLTEVKNLLKSYSNAELLLLLGTAVAPNEMDKLRAAVDGLRLFVDKLQKNDYATHGATVEVFSEDLDKLGMFFAAFEHIERCHTNFRGYEMMPEFSSMNDVKPDKLLFTGLGALADISVADKKKDRGMFQELHIAMMQVKGFLGSTTGMNSLYAISETRRLQVLADLKNNMIDPMRSKLSYGCLSGCGLFGKKKSSAIPGVKDAVNGFVKDLKQIKPISLADSVAGKESCLQPLSLKYAK